MNRWLLIILALLMTSCSRTQEPDIQHHPYSLLPVWHPDYQTTYSSPYDSGVADVYSNEEIQCPIPMEHRVKNYTGIQCVFSTIETLARWSGCKELLEPDPLTSRTGCKSYSGPSHAASILDKYGVKYEQSYRTKAEGIALIKKAMADGRACLFGVPGHAMTLCHYDEEENVVYWIDNSDSRLAMQKGTVDWFHKRWDIWVLVIYADPDRFGADLANQIPIVDRNNPQGEYPKNYIPKPK